MEKLKIYSANGETLLERDLSQVVKPLMLLAGDAPQLAIRIRNERNQASAWQKGADGEWVPLPEGPTDVSGFHHNNFKGFFALRPAYLLAGGAELIDFEYKPL